jgi:UDP-glucose-4-epimerase GalE
MSSDAQHILVTGGAGYIGSHTARALARRGWIPVAFDSLARGHRWAVRWGPLVHADIGDRAALAETIRSYRISAIIHFAAFAYVGESMQHPDLYYNNNVAGSLTLLDVAIETGIRHIVFSSSCTTYGIPACLPITEATPQSPINPYGETKIIVERALRWYSQACGFSWAALRYFNAAGADPNGEIGEVHSPETHLIPLVLESALGGRPVNVFGDDYPTPDGTCIRDYIHVSDLAEAHVRALDYLMRGGPSLAMNLGTGEGHSVRQVIAAAESVTGRKIPFQLAPRRPGDPPVLVADPSLANSTLGWYPEYSSLDTIVHTAWNWHSRRTAVE